MEQHEIKTRLTALQNLTSELTRHVGSNYLSDAVLDIFSRYQRLRDILRSDYSSLFDDLPVRDIPPSSGTASGRPLVGGEHLVLLHRDITYCLDILNNIHDTLPSIDVTREGVFFAGQYFDALKQTTEILSQAQQDIAIVDGYIDEMVLNILTSKTSGVSVRILTKQHSVTPALKTTAIAFNKQYGNISIRITNAFHDRFVIIDDRDYFHFGASIKDLGHRGFMFSRIEELEVVQALRAKLQHEWVAATVAI